MRNYLFNLLIFVIFFLTETTVNAANLAVSDSQSCAKLANTSKPFILVLKRGESLVEAITSCVKAAHFASASLSGLGSIEDPVLAYYNLQKNYYQYKKFIGVYELISLQGNITQVDNAPFAHIHVAIANSQYEMWGGHLSKARIGATAEFTVIPLRTVITRTASPNADLKLITP